MKTDHKIYYTFYAQCKERDVAKYFTQVLLDSNQSQRNVLDAMVRFCRDEGFIMPEKAIDHVTLKLEAKGRRRSKLLSIKKQASKK